MAESLEIALGNVLRERGWTIAVAETTTGGMISARIVAVPGSSAYFERGVIAYSKASKCEMLGLDEQALNTYGAVSAEAARAMAMGIRKASGANLGLAETGIAGPIRGRSPKPIGTAYIALASATAVMCKRVQFPGDRDAIRNAITTAALRLAIKAVKATPDNHG